MSSTTFDLTKNILLRAGAGAGKTTTLTELFFRYAEDFKQKNGQLPKIAITTFTRKATQEIKERLLKMALDKKSSELFHFVSNKSTVQISTIHGILSLYLSQFGAEIGLTPDFKIFSDKDLRSHYRAIVRNLLLEDEAFRDLLEYVTFGQLQVALDSYYESKMQAADREEFSFANKQIQIDLIKQKIREFYKAFEIVIQGILQETQEEKYRDYYSAILRWPWHFESEADLEIFLSCAKSFFDGSTRPRLSKQAYSPELHEQFGEIKDDFVHFLRQDCLESKFLENHDALCTVFQSLAQKYFDQVLAHKISSGLISMADLELISIYLMKLYPSTSSQFSQAWDYWMIDEYQDTSPLQVSLLNGLIGDQRAFVVGDPQQSIYLFRGARSEVFSQKYLQVTQSGDQYEFRTDNWRSQPGLLAFFNYVFFRIDNKKFSSMTTQLKKNPTQNGEPACDARVIVYDGKADENAEAGAVTAYVQNLIEKQNVPAEKICILGRTNGSLEELAAAFASHRIPANLHNKGSFFNRREIQDAMLILKFLVNPHDNLNLVSLLRSPWLHLADSVIAGFCRKTASSYWTELVSSGLPVIELMQSYRLELSDSGVGKVFLKILVERGLFDSATRLDSSGRREANLWKLFNMVSQEERMPGFNLLKLLSGGFLESNPDEDDGESDAATVIEPQRVNLMTIHASKGLQFEHVILVGLNKRSSRSRSSVFAFDEDSGYWTLQVMDEDSQSMKSSIFAQRLMARMAEREGEESHRVLYVAMTRAKTSLTMLVDEMPSKGSWGELIPVVRETGVKVGQFENIEFAYEVVRDFEGPVVWTAEDQYLDAVREPFQDLEIIKNSENRKKNTVAVSEILREENTVGLHENPDWNLELSLEQVERARTGTLAHRLFEDLKYFDIEDIRRVADPHQMQMLEFLTSQREVPLGRIIEHGFVEYGFTVDWRGRRIQGQIDLWGRADDCVWVIDYKTGSSKFSDAAFRQLEIYADALQILGHLKKSGKENSEKIMLAVMYTRERFVKLREYSPS